MASDHIELIRAHLEKHKHREQAYFSVAGVRLLLLQRDELKAQVERLLAAQGKRLLDALRSM